MLILMKMAVEGDWSNLIRKHAIRSLFCCALNRVGEHSATPGSTPSFPCATTMTASARGGAHIIMLCCRKYVVGEVEGRCGEMVWLMELWRYGGMGDILCVGLCDGCGVAATGLLVVSKQNS